MKNSFKIIFTLFLFIAASECYGQKLQAEIITGPVLSRNWGSEFYRESNARFKVSVSGGVGINFLFNDRSSFNTRIIFERKVYAMRSDMRDVNNVNTGKVTSNANFDYLSLPLLYGRTFGNNAMKFKLEAGPYVAFLLSSKFKTLYQGGNGPVITDYARYYKKFDAGISAGISMLVPMKENIKLKLGLMNNVGLFNIATGPSYKNQPIRTYSMDIIVGVVYDL